MSPTYNDGDWLLVKLVEPEQVKRLALGTVVMVEREDRPGIFLIKRLQKAHGDRYWVEGDNSASTDSRQWGWITHTEIVGRVIRRIKQSKNQIK